MGGGGGHQSGWRGGVRVDVKAMLGVGGDVGHGGARGGSQVGGQGVLIPATPSLGNKVISRYLGFTFQTFVYNGKKHTILLIAKLHFRGKQINCLF